ncbi:MAG: anion permease [Gammaproteobacteria bacterium]|nr:anion permease [Gammaproteobacteria bacterium]
MSTDQAIVFAVLAMALVMFIWGRFRYDLVALLALMAVVLTGVLPIDQAFTGFAHPAVITVAAVLVISRALQNAGIVDVVIRVLAPFKGRVNLQLIAQTLVVAVLSAFMNNIGAMALMLPVALRNAYREGYSPAKALMPLAFGSILGGMVTLIGTPPNIIISTFREEALGEGFSMFAFAPVGGAVAVLGVLFVAVVGWRLIPAERVEGESREALFDMTDYITELRVPEDSKVSGKSIDEIENLVDDDAVIVGWVRGESRRLVPHGYEQVHDGDLLIVEADPAALKELITATDLLLEEEHEFSREDLGSDEVVIYEAIVGTASSMRGRTPATLRLRTRHGLNLLAVARQGRKVKRRLSHVKFQPGDVLLLQGPEERVQAALGEFGLMPLAERDVNISRPRHLMLSAGIFMAAIIMVVAGVLPAHIAFVAAVAALALLNVIKRDELYTSVDWPVIVLLGAMIPVGTALELTGGTALLADGMLGLTGGMGAVWVLVILMVGTMFLSDIINNNATAVLMAPLALDLAGRLQVNPDPLLMAVAIGASCAFLTPIGHQSNTLVFEPGGYKFGDYWRMGLPLELLIVAISVPLLLVVFPF